LVFTFSPVYPKLVSHILLVHLPPHKTYTRHCICTTRTGNNAFANRPAVGNLINNIVWTQVVCCRTKLVGLGKTICAYTNTLCTNAKSKSLDSIILRTCLLSNTSSFSSGSYVELVIYTIYNTSRWCG